MSVTRPVLRYYGSKWRLSSWIIDQFPAHVCYVEPYCGSAAVFFNKPPSQIEVLNDLDGEIVNFFEVLRNNTDEFIRLIELTPYSRDEYELATNEIEKTDPIERARLFYLRVWQGWGGSKLHKNGGWRYQHSYNRGKSVIEDWRSTVHLFEAAHRLMNAFIENDCATKVIERYDQPDTLFYLDPPYLPSERCERWKNTAYAAEMDHEDHENLLQKIVKIEGMVIISGYPSELYEDYLHNWSRVQKKSRTTNTQKLGTEIVWFNPACETARLPLLNL